MVDEYGEAFVGRRVGLDVFLAVLGEPYADGLKLRHGLGRFEELVVRPAILLPGDRHGEKYVLVAAPRAKSALFCFFFVQTGKAFPLVSRYFSSFKPEF